MEGCSLPIGGGVWQCPLLRIFLISGSQNAYVGAFRAILSARLLLRCNISRRRIRLPGLEFQAVSSGERRELPQWGLVRGPATVRFDAL